MNRKKSPWSQFRPVAGRRKKKRVIPATRKEITAGTKEYIKKGGKITIIEPVQRARPSKSGVRPALINYDISAAADQFLMGVFYDWQR